MKAEVSGQKTSSRRSRANATILNILDKQAQHIRRISLAILVLRLSPILVPIALRFTLDPLLEKSHATIWGYLLSPLDLLWALILLSVVVAVIRAVASFYYISLAGRTGHALVADFRVAMYEQILRLPVSYADRRGTGKILLRFIGDSDALRIWYSRTEPGVWANRVLLVILAITMFFVNWKLALTTLLPLPFLFFFVRRFSPGLGDLTGKSRRLQAGFVGHVESRFDSIRQTKWFDRDRRNRKATRELVDGIAQQNAARDRHAAILESVGQFLGFLCVPFLIGVGVWSVWNDNITIGHFIPFIWLAAHMAVTLNRLTSATVMQQKAKVSTERIESLLSRKAERGRSSKQPEFEAKGKTFQCENLVFADRGIGSRGQPFNLKIEQAGIHVLDEDFNITRWFDVLLGFRKPQRGKVFFDEQRSTKVSILSLRQEIGWIPLQPVIFDGTILDNIQLAAPRLKKVKIIQAIQQCGFSDEKLDSWLKKDAGANGNRLQDADIMRISLFRVAVRQPKFLLVEEIVCSNENMEELRILIEHLRDRAVVFLPASVSQNLAEPTSQVESSQVSPPDSSAINAGSVVS